VIAWRRPGRTRTIRHLRGAGLSEPPALRPFVAPELDAEEFRNQIDHLADSLASSVDEATPHVLDNLINSRADRWRYETDVAYAAYRAGARLPQGEVAARLELTRDLWVCDLGRLAEIGLAVSTALSQLMHSDDEEFPADDRG
jgi:hypothetical protein